MPNYCEPIADDPPEPHKCSYEPWPRCPYCNYSDEDAWELGNGGEEDGTTECPNCNRQYMYQRRISVTYSTKPIIGPHPEKHE